MSLKEESIFVDESIASFRCNNRRSFVVVLAEDEGFGIVPVVVPNELLLLGEELPFGVGRGGRSFVLLRFVMEFLRLLAVVVVLLPKE